MKTNIVAERKFRFNNKDVRVTLYTPVQDGTGSYLCRMKVDGMRESGAKLVRGTDSLHALQTAIQELQTMHLRFAHMPIPRGNA